MKITVKQYALSLYECVKDKKKKDLEQILKKFVDLLITNNDIHKAESILRVFSKIWNKNKGIVEAIVMSANDIDGPTLNLLNDYIKEATSAEKVVTKKEERKELLGGAVLKYGDKILDASLKTKLRSFNEELKK